MKKMRMRGPHTRRALALALASGAITRPAFAAGDFLGGLAASIDAAGRIWGPALLVLAALIAGGAIAMGSHNSGEKVRNFLLGAIFLVMAAAGGAALLSKLQSLLN